MPTFPISTRCAQYGCRNPRSKLNTYCLDHGGKEALERDYDSIYSTRAWKQIRAAQMSLQPLCQACLIEGKVTQAAHVDHVFPWRKFGEQAFRRNIFSSLCHGHHSRKTALEQRGIYEAYTDKVEQFGDEDYGRVVNQGLA